MKGAPTGRHAVLLGLFSGLSFYVAYPPLMISIAMVLALLPIVWMCVHATPRQAGVTAMVAALGLLPSQYWILSQSFAIGMVGVALTIASLALGAALSAALLRVGSRLSAIWLIPTVFVGLEFARSRTFPPYLAFHTVGAGGMGNDGNLATIVISVLGVHGLSFVLIMLGTLCVVISGRARTRIEAIGPFALAIGLAGVLMTPFPSLALPVPEEEDRFVFAGVQSDRSSLTEFVLLSRLAMLLPVPSDLVVWPARVLDYNPTTNPAAIEAIRQTVEYTKLPLFLGFLEAGSDGRRRNSASIWSPELIETFHFSQVYPGWFEHMEAGTAPVVAELSGFNVGFVIGTDIDSESVFRDLVDQGAEVVIAIGNEPMSWTKVGHLHQLVAMRLRAVESGRDIGRVASVGISAVTRSSGRDIILCPAGEREFVASYLGRYSGRTLYVRGGWLFPHLILVLLLFTLSRWLFRSFPTK